MVYNPIFEEEIDRDRELTELRKAIKLRAGKDQVMDLCTKFSTFLKNHPVVTTAAIGVFSYALSSGKRN